jgi:hypothetical protein
LFSLLSLGNTKIVKMKHVLTLLLFPIATLVFALGNNPTNGNPNDPNLIARANGFMQQTSKGFEENKGQVTGEDANRVKFMLKDGNLSLFLMNDGIAYQFNRVHYPKGYSSPDKLMSIEEQQRMEELAKEIRLETYRMDVQLVGANPNARITTEGKSNDYVQYYNHNALNVHNYSKITYHEVYSHIDWVIYSKDGHTKYDFVVRPGGDPNQIKLKTNWVEDLHVNADGSLSMRNKMGEITENTPISFQEDREIRTQFVVKNGTIGFNLDTYSKNEELIIDPTLIWATYYGGSGNDEGWSCATDGAGNVFLGGYTNSATNISDGGHQMTSGGGIDGFLVKFNSNGIRQWATYYGGTGSDDVRAIATDNLGNVFIAGMTNSATNIAFNGHQNALAGSTDIFIVKFNTNGLREWSTYYGGTLAEQMSSFNTITTDSDNNLYATGLTASPTNIYYSGGHQSTHGGQTDAFLVKFNSSGIVQWGTYYGGSLNDYGRSCTIDPSGNVYLVGWTQSSNNISFSGFQNSYAGGNDGFLVKFNASGVRQWASYYGGTANDDISSCATDNAGNVYILGSTASTTGIASGGHQNSYGGGANDAFLVKFNGSGARLWGTYYGGSQNDLGNAMRINSSNNVFVVGSTGSSSAIASNGFQNTFGGNADAFLIKFNDLGVRLWGTYLGSAPNEDGYSCSIDGSGNVYVAGRTASTSNIAFNGHSNTFNGGTWDAYLAKFDGVCDPVAAPSGSSSQSFCLDATVANLVASGSNIQWYTSPAGGSSIPSNTVLNSGATYYGSQTISGCESLTRLAVSVTIIDPSAPTGDANQTLCQNSSIDDILVVGNDIQWYETASGGSPLATGTILTNGLTYYATQTISSCESNTRLAVNVTINPSPAAPNADGTQTICNSGTISDLSAVGTNIQWYSTATGGTPLSPVSLLVEGIYYATQTINGCESLDRASVIVNISVTNAPTGNANQAFCNEATIGDLNVAGSNIQWYSDPTGGSPLVASTLLVNGNSYYATQTTASCESSNSLAVAVTVNTIPTAPTGASAQTTCGGTLANLTVTGSNIQWYSASTGGSPLASNTPLVNGNTYFASQTVNGCESTDRLAVTVTSETSAPTAATAQEYCDGATLNSLSFTITGSNILFYSAPTGGSPLAFNTPLVNGTTYYVSQTVNSCESVTRLAITTTVYTFTNNMSAPSPQEFCGGATVANLVATGTPGATISWFTNSNGWLFGATPLPSSTQLVNNTTYYAGQSFGTNDLCKYVGTAGALVIINSPTAPTGSAAQTFCNSATVANLSATGTGIQWYTVPTGGTAISAGTALTDGTTYYASQTVSGCESTDRLAVLVTINTTSAPTGANTQSVCSGATIADLSATGTSIQWYDAPTGGTALAAGTVLTNGTTYYASQTANGCESATRLDVSVVFGIPNAPTGAAAQTFCNSATVADLVASGSNIQWYAASSGGTALTAGTALTTGSTYYASQTSGGCESTDRLEVTATINIPAAPIGTVAQEFCNAATVADLTATGSGIQWYTAPSGGTALTSGTALSNGTYYASQTISGCESINRLEVTVTINIPSAPTGTTTQSFCGTATLADITVTGANITWYDAASVGTVLGAGTALADGVTYFASQTVNGCESINRLAVTATVNAIPAAPTASAAQEFCNNATVANLSATGTAIQWYAAASGGTALAVGTVLNNGITYHASQTVNGCESTDRLAVTVTINTPATPTGTANQEFCNAATVADLTATGTGIQWYTAPTGGTALTSGTALSNGTYYASQTLSGCESANRLTVIVTVNTPTAPAGTTTQSFCGAATLDDIAVTGANITWYDAAAAGTVLTGGTTLVDGATYFASQTVNSCESIDRLTVTATVNTIPAAPTAAPQEFCNGATVADLTATGSGVQWFTAASGGTALTIGTTLASGSYFAAQTVNGCESTDRTEVTVNIITPATPTGDAAQNFCSASTVADLTATGTAIQWYTQATGGTALAAGTALSNGTYYASQTINGCESERLEVTVTITILDATATENGLTLTANQAGAAYTWVDCNNSNQPIAGATAQSYTATANGSYAVIVEQNGCSVTSNCVAITTVSLDDIKTELFRIYPNPASTVINVEMANASTVRMFDISGKLLKELNGSSNYTIDVTDLTPGMYMIESAEGAKAKFVKQ